MTTATPTAEEIEQVQTKTGEIHSRLESDMAFRAQYKADPIGTLTGAGLPEAAAKELLTKSTKAAGHDDVSGYDYYVDHVTYYKDGSALIRRDWYTDFGVWYLEQLIVVS